MGDGQVAVIEWAERIAALLPENTVFIKMTGAGEEPREILMQGEENLKEAE